MSIKSILRTLSDPIKETCYPRLSRAAEKLFYLLESLDWAVTQNIQNIKYRGVIYSLGKLLGIELSPDKLTWLQDKVTAAGFGSVPEAIAASQAIKGTFDNTLASYTDFFDTVTQTHTLFTINSNRPGHNFEHLVLQLFLHRVGAGNFFKQAKADPITNAILQKAKDEGLIDQPLLTRNGFIQWQVKTDPLVALAAKIDHLPYAAKALLSLINDAYRK